MWKKKEVKEIKVSHRSGLTGFGWATLNLCLDDENKYMTIKSNKENVYLKYDQIIDINTIDEEKTTEKDKSVVGRALVGGVVLGPIGAAVGGMSGIGSKKSTKTSCYMVINYKSKNAEISQLKFALKGGPWADFIWSVRHRIKGKEKLETTRGYL
ncbi:hypothetical protein [Clostridium sp. HBUAS56017]|uniref:hypothetical protein n=1 Tax=Clostridium sp. HBUAS56017 TaxID=2571128 RepID=UPI001177EE19|nr:hypothetical protein [Clostridium sp. HBUAS56017]